MERTFPRFNPMRRVRAGLVRSFQVTRLFADMTPEQHVALAILQREGKSGRVAGSFQAMPDVMRETYAILETLNLVGLARTPVSEIAYGQQRLLEIALAMALRPKVLLAGRTGCRRAPQRYIPDRKCIGTIAG